MKKLFYTMVCTAAMLLGCKEESPVAGPTNWPKPEGEQSVGNETYRVGDALSSVDLFKLVWADEFNTNGMINADNWTYEKGFVRNEEIQYYTENRAENCKVQDGFLVITGRKESAAVATPTAFSDGTYTSASIITNKKQSWQYGRFEIRAKVPAGKGPWPAFWAKGDNQNTGQGWPRCGEIDIMEYAAKGPEMIHNAIYGESSSDVKQVTKKIATDYSKEFHVYSLDWNADRLVFAIDNIVTHVVDIRNISPNPFRQKFSILLNLALGASTERTLGGKLDPTILPVEFKVDYVRIYQAP
ncbi:MAG: glycoside hydrolase family 16 protein [Niabella sp.]